MRATVPELGSWYTVVYMLACEPAHISDLPDYISWTAIEIGQPTSTALLADTALFYGLQMMLHVGTAILDTTELQLTAPIDDLKRGLYAIAGTTLAPPVVEDELGTEEEQH